MEETSEDEEHALNSWQQNPHHQQQHQQQYNHHHSYHEHSTFNQTVTSGVNLWNSPETEKSTVIRIELNKGDYQ